MGAYLFVHHSYLFVVVDDVSGYEKGALQAFADAVIEPLRRLGKAS